MSLGTKIIIGLLIVNAILMGVIIFEWKTEATPTQMEVLDEF